MKSDCRYRRTIEKDLSQALARAGLLNPRSIADDLRKEGFEEGYLESRLLVLTGKYNDGEIALVTYQHRALTLHEMLCEREEDPKAFGLVIKRWREKHGKK